MYEDELDEFELYDEMDDEFEDEDDEVYDELAAELLEIEDEEELEEFFGSLIKAASGFLKSPVGRSLIKKAKSVAKRALPSVAGAVGDAIGGSTGRRLGSSLGRFAASRFEMEEYEMDAAKRVIKTVCTAAKHAAKTQGAAPPTVVAKQAMAKAVKKHKPTLPIKAAVKGKPISRAKLATALPNSYRGGRWVRRGRNIIVMGM